MKIESRILVRKEDIQKIREADSSVKGTDNYMQYRMEMSCKFFNEENAKWTRWNHIGYDVPYRNNPEWANSGYITRIRNGNVFIESLQYIEGGIKTVDRYRVTDEVMKLLDWEI